MSTGMAPSPATTVGGGATDPIAEVVTHSAAETESNHTGVAECSADQRASTSDSVEISPAPDYLPAQHSLQSSSLSPGFVDAVPRKALRRSSWTGLGLSSPSTRESPLKLLGIAEDALAWMCDTIHSLVRKNDDTDDHSDVEAEVDSLKNKSLAALLQVRSHVSPQPPLPPQAARRRKSFLVQSSHSLMANPVSPVPIESLPENVCLQSPGCRWHPAGTPATALSNFCSPPEDLDSPPTTSFESSANGSCQDAPFPFPSSLGHYASECALASAAALADHARAASGGGGAHSAACSTRSFSSSVAQTPPWTPSNSTGVDGRDMGGSTPTRPGSLPSLGSPARSPPRSRSPSPMQAFRLSHTVSPLPQIVSPGGQTVSPHAKPLTVETLQGAGLGDIVPIKGDEHESGLRKPRSPMQQTETNSHLLATIAPTSTRDTRAQLMPPSPMIKVEPLSSYESMPNLPSVPTEFGFGSGPSLSPTSPPVSSNRSRRPSFSASPPVERKKTQPEFDVMVPSVLATEDNPTLPDDAHLVMIRSLRKIISRFSNIQNLRDIGKAGMRCAQFFVGVPSAACYMFDPGTGELDLAGCIGWTPEEQREALKTAWDRHPGMVIREKRRLHVGDTDMQNTLNTGGLTDKKRKMHVRSRLWLPIVQDEGLPTCKVLGALGFASPEPHYFKISHIEALEMVVDLLVMSYGTLTSSLKIISAVGKYLCPSVTRQISEGKDATLGGVQARITSMFVDVRNFTAVTESLPASTVVKFLNSYFTYISESVFRQDGAVDKFIGDGMMAVFGLTEKRVNDELRACLAALDVVKQAERFRAETGGEFKVGVGLATGEVVAGNIGCPRFMSYTVIGDSVNLAARLEPLTKRYGVDIIVGEPCAKVRGELFFVELDKVRVLGKSKATVIYHLVAISRSDVSEQLLEATDLYAKGYTLYGLGQLLEARAWFQASNDKGYRPGQVMVQRCEEMGVEEYREPWDGVYVCDMK